MARYALLSMWLRPQAAICRLVASNGSIATLALAAMAGIFVAKLLTVFVAPGIGVWVHPAAVVLIGAAAGIAGLYVAGALAFLGGWLLGGVATFGESRRALAWMAIPNSLAVTFLAAAWLALPVFGLPTSPSLAIDPLGALVLMLLVSPFGLWGLVVSIRAFGAVQNFGALRSALNLGLVGGVLWYAFQALGAELDARSPSFVMPNDAMLPTLAPFERFRLAASAKRERGDVVVFARKRHHPHYGIVSDHYVKRIIGLPGDVIGITHGELSINGEPVKRERQGDFTIAGENGQQKSVPRFSELLPNGVSYSVLDSDTARTLAGQDHTVPPDDYFLLGDNRDNSEDSAETYLSPPTPASSPLVHRTRLGSTALLKRHP
jgi:signal peptidase I